MLESVSFDQLRTFLAAAQEGSFSAAGRKLKRAQSVVSQTIANLEAQLTVQLFDRAGRVPRLTDQGRALLSEALGVVKSMDGFKARARGLAEGLEPSFSVVMDVMYPMHALTHAVGEFQQAFPTTPLRLYVEALGAIIQPVVEGRCRIGVIGSVPIIPENFEAEHLLDVQMVSVAAPSHPLASHEGMVSKSSAARHIQLVLSDRSERTNGRDFGVLSPLTWRLSDLGAKHSFLRAGFGWGHMPLPMVMQDLSRGDLVQLQVAGFPREAAIMPMHATWRKDSPPGPAGRWLIEQLKKDAVKCPSVEQQGAAAEPSRPPHALAASAGYATSNSTSVP